MISGQTCIDVGPGRDNSITVVPGILHVAVGADRILKVVRRSTTMRLHCRNYDGCAIMTVWTTEQVTWSLSALAFHPLPTFVT